MNVVSIKKDFKTACNSINHTQPLPARIRMLTSWSWLNTTNIKLSLLVKTSENFTPGNAFSIKFLTPWEELVGVMLWEEGGSVWQYYGPFLQWCQLSATIRKHLLKFKHPTEVCQTIALIWTWKQYYWFQSWCQLFKRCGWHYPQDN